MPDQHTHDDCAECLRRELQDTKKKLAEIEEHAAQLEKQNKHWEYYIQQIQEEKNELTRDVYSLTENNKHLSRSITVAARSSDIGNTICDRCANHKRNHRGYDLACPEDSRNGWSENDRFIERVLVLPSA